MIIFLERISVKMIVWIPHGKAIEFVYISKLLLINWHFISSVVVISTINSCITVVFKRIASEKALNR